MAEAVKRDVFGEIAFVQDRFQVTPGYVGELHWAADLVGENEVVIEPRSLHREAVFVGFAAVRDEALSEAFGDGDPSA